MVWSGIGSVSDTTERLTPRWVHLDSFWPERGHDMAAKEYECIDLVSGSAGAALANRLSEEASVIEVRTNSVPIYGGRRDQ
jgi:hypothetical protein